ncbi:2-oxoacid:acceptor oxidoreductase family protein [Desulfosporosinus shakirovi]|uniref:2-oxoacid:acceptor oxidoreductase family protein n=1 Tax=Desulfosporosinus shakirovi TaxID=2885154 RepID=UPI001E30929E|nr:2-oxoacid:acceptor oxidoreductase family protein [Desulfosporosinus sp. SRJS8]MCB8815548.1 2-oxoacid:acceptor oxidoreductase family protein [Desulfosporosinus sp. SRJS8]
MREIRFHGRFGQPVGKLSRAIGQELLRQGKNVQVFDAFAAVRPGAPMYSILRVGDESIRKRSANNTSPDIVVVLDNSLFDVIDVTKGIKADGTVMALGMTENALGDKLHGSSFVSLDPYFEPNSSDVAAVFLKVLAERDVLVVNE